MSPSSFSASSITQGFPKSRSLLAGNYAYGGGATWLIERINVGSAGAANVTFSNIPQTFKHLQLRFFTRNSGAETLGQSYTTFNGSGTGYTNHYMYGDGFSVSTGGLSYTTVMWSTVNAGNSLASNVFGAGIIDILDYTNTNKYKSIRALSGVDGNGTGQVWFGSGMWQNTSAITSVTWRGNYYLSQYSTAALYGVVG